MLEQPEEASRDKATQGMPTWVKGFAIAGAVLIVLVVVILVTGGHGPGRHTQGGSLGPVVGHAGSTIVAPA